jgi:hypothetical protein
MKVGCVGTGLGAMSMSADLELKSTEASFSLEIES